ncbi:hypothetical protein LGZ99_21690 [Photorhabdus temperata]|uniref:Photorhabdus luminescens subsp. laumondii TTO1 complete genome segment 10/17 n=1 Tax=Photorhabdus laumondii subsp. laumondii (strain DSM 15139 / CIP 105565 / TT01) TaxID=243265 RepID=Q7N345_PHOLL|nr:MULTISPECIES: hypothetical protein [Photorhabdus]AWK42588.1 hypothetical protein A4R40_14350 [Photorhabdus laumondii subsp. laumondii]AXG47913.1 hypothetical protein PluTT01m_14770 [Photorhabdus laumondii subsp. laumondii]MCT8349739.1 hypothetical protein [Photorhabdus temperata]CAE15251.1 unnamed protein product [Photorhabdus laumondii subsp. laumondii TTO1]
MRVRRLDNNHDWTFGDNRSDYATKSDAIAQCVQTRLMSLRNDWFLNPDHGVRWFDYLRKNPNLMQMESELKTTVLKTDGVIEITDFDIQIDRDSRKSLVTVTYIDIYGNRNEVNADAQNY